MLTRRMIRASMVPVLAFMTSACATSNTQRSDLAWGPVDGPMCSVRVESAYDVPIEAGASAGAQEVQLGLLDPRGAQEFGVPCAHGAVTVFRVVRSGEVAEARLGIRSRALDADDVTVVTLRPTLARSHAANRR